MKPTYSLLAALLLATASLSSCSRSTYSFNNQVPAYLGTAHQLQQAAPIPAAAPAAPVASTVGPTAAPAQPNLARPATTRAAQPCEALPAVAAPAAAAVVVEVAPPARPVHHSLVQRLVLKRMATQLRKIQVARQNVAQVEKGQAFSKAGRAALIALIGAVLVAIVITAGMNSTGDAVGLILLGIIGYALLVTGIVLLVISLVNGS